MARTDYESRTIADDKVSLNLSGTMYQSCVRMGMERD